MRPIRSLCRVTGLYSTPPLSNFPEYTLKKNSLPKNGSTATLKANAENGSSTLLCLSTTSSGFAGDTPSIGGKSTGLGRYCTTASSSGSTHLFLNADPHNTGTAFNPITASRRVFRISSLPTGFPSRYSVMMSSSKSESASIIASLPCFASTASSGGITPSLGGWPSTPEK